MGKSSTRASRPSNVLESSKSVLEQTKSTFINKEAIETFVSSFDRDSKQSKDAFNNGGTRYPLSFDSIASEINMMALVSLLSFGSGYQVELNHLVQRSVHETMLFGVLGMHLTAPKINASFLEALTLSSIESYFGIPLEKDEELQVGIYISKPGPLKPLAIDILSMLHKTAEVLKRTNNCDNLGSWILQTLEACDDDTPCSDLVESMCNTFSFAFDDRAERDSLDVVFLSKAQTFVGDLYRRFKNNDSVPKSHFKDITGLTCRSDSILPSVLRQMGILKLPKELLAIIESGKSLNAYKNWECELRSATIVAVHMISMEFKEEFSMIELDAYLLNTGKSPEHRDEKRHLVNNTVFY